MFVHSCWWNVGLKAYYYSLYAINIACVLLTQPTIFKNCRIMNSQNPKYYHLTALEIPKPYRRSRTLGYDFLTFLE